jgi:hypothetical protein
MSDDEILEKLCNGLTPAIITREAHGDTYNWCMCVSEGAIAILRSLGWGPVGEARDKALEEAAKVCSETCEKCSGYGWLWAHELDHYHNPDNRDPRSDPTRYSCDGEAHKTAAAIRALKDKL